MSAASDFLEPLLLDKSLNNEDFTVAATHVALFTAQPGDGNTGIEVTGGSYARVEVFPKTSASTPRWNAAAASGDAFVVDNEHAITFPQATATWGTVTSFGIYDAATVGNLLYWGPLANSPVNFIGLNTGDIIHAQAHGFANDNKVVFQSQDVPGTLPTGISEETEYFVINSATDNFQVSTTMGGAAVTITADGSGIVYLSSWKVINTNDTASFPIGSLNIELF